METNKKIQFTKIRDVKSPARAHSHDAGTDFFIPEYSFEFLKDLKMKNEKNFLRYILDGEDDGNDNYTLRIVIPAGEQINIPSGIKVNILDKNTYLEANNKSGIASWEKPSKDWDNTSAEDQWNFNTRKIELIQEFIYDNDYTIHWENDLFQILVPPTDKNS